MSEESVKILYESFTGNTILLDEIYRGGYTVLFTIVYSIG